MPLKILITGATGFIGTALVSKLRSEGHDLVILTRDPVRAQKKLGDQVTIHRHSISERELDELIGSSDAVVNLAGEPVIGKRWTADQKKKILNSRVQLTGRLARSIQESDDPPAVFLSASAVGYYGDTGTREVTSTDDPGSDFLADVCIKWESAALQAASDRVRVVIPRIGMVLGKGGGALAKMITPFRLGLGGPIGSGRQFVSWIHVHDLVQLMLTALTDDRYRGAFNATAPGPVIFSDFARALGAAVHRPAILPVPEFAIRMLFGEAAEILLTGQNVIPHRALENGFDFEFETVKSALHELLGER